MTLHACKEFPYSLDVAWIALHQPDKLDVEPGSEVQPVSATEWQAHNAENGSVTTYTASFDDENKKLTIEGASNKKHDHDFIYLTLRGLAQDRVALEIDIELNTGVHLLAKALGKLLAKPMMDILSRQIYHNFEALCSGQETKRMSADELKYIAAKTMEK